MQFVTVYGCIFSPSMVLCCLLLYTVVYFLLVWCYAVQIRLHIFNDSFMKIVKIVSVVITILFYLVV